MRLTQIKLAGFKSFVDPTVIPVSGQLVGVVGPNGCGKSNIIDAVRWVMGESRATELRGESMQDVIFNGSDERKRAARASVELVFDNTRGRMGGQWGSYAELSVRRVLTRDGASTYFINSQVVRRRDVHDLFLGTGLGTRGYAIIGQGMINRLIEARPHELRVYLEEAAGVSRYKERRRETENRLRDTRDNLLRLQDILQELDVQLQHLQQQAEQASRYRRLQAELHQQQQLLWLIQEDQALARRQQAFAAMEQTQLQSDAIRAELRRKEAEIERTRQDHEAAAASLHETQGELYRLGADVSRLEAERRHAVATQERVQARQQSLQQQQEQWQEQIVHHTDRLNEQQAHDEIRLARQEEAEMRLESAREHEASLEADGLAAQGSVDALRADMARLEQQLARSEQRADDARSQRQRLISRQRAALDEQQALTPPDDHELKQAQQALDTWVQEAEAHVLQLSELDAALEQAQARAKITRQASEQLRGQQAQLQASHQALVDLQKRVGQPHDLSAWLAQQGLAEAAPLWQSLKVEAGWETAVEAVLDERMAALAVDELSDWLDGRALPTCRVTLYRRLSVLPDQHQVPPLDSDRAVAESFLRQCPPLLSKVTANDSILTVLRDWLEGVHIAKDLDAALAWQNRLQPGQCLVVAAGHRIDRHGIRFFAAHTDQSGVLARQTEIRELAQRLNETQEQLQHATEADQLAQQACVDLQQQRRHLQGQVEAARHQQHEATVYVHTLRQQHEQSRQLQARLQQEQAERHDEIARLQAELDAAMADAEAQQMELDQRQHELERLQTEAGLMSDRLQAHREQCQDLALQLQQLEHEKQTIQARIDEHTRHRQLATEQLEQAQIELKTLQGELFDLDEETINRQLQTALTARVETEAALEEARKHHDQLAAKLRAHEEARMQQRARLEPLQARLVELQLAEQAARLEREQHAEALKQAKADRSALQLQRSKLTSQEQDPARLQTAIQQLKRRLQAMGDVNLAALKELDTANQRKGFLDSQHDDLQDAVQTLENAILKIDRETRELLAHTFEQVNRHFGELFPQLFGGGRAALAMTGEEILDAGVQVTAQPPGKRNTTIQLLSGGEKALTAIALVFSLFQLNPAPFCLLDEVDAPLDDANTSRFAELVSSMSEQTQFVFVSHNKIAMQMATQLIGVTMQEQGVSRIVSVDMASAMEMAEAPATD